jgi:hypothetical protein
MSLLTEQSSNLLGIGEGSVRDFAEGIRTRSKAQPGMTREAELAQATASEGQDARLRDTGDIRPTHDPKKTQGARLKLTEDDRAFIQAVRKVENKLFKGEKEIGKSNTEELKKQIGGLLQLGAQSSRGGLSEVWSGVYDRIQGASGRTAPGGLAKLQDAFGKALTATNKVLDTTVDINTYQFERGRTAAERLGVREKQFAGKHSKAAQRGELEATNFWDNPAYQRTYGELGINEKKRVRLEGGASLRDFSTLAIGKRR